MVFFSIPNDPLFLFLFGGALLIIWAVIRVFSGPEDEIFRCPHCYRNFTRPSELRHIKEANCPYCRKRVTFKNK